MHDQLKVKEEVDEETRERNRIAVVEFTTLHDSILQHRREGVYTEAVLEKLTDLLRKNPEAYSMYNYRREVLLHLWEEAKKQGQEQKQQKQEEEEEEQQQQESTARIAPSDATPSVESETAPLKATNPPVPCTVRSPQEWLKEELKLSSAILKQDFKIYAAFVHRRWIFDQLYRLAEEAVVAKRRDTCIGDNGSDGTFGDCPEFQFWVEVLIKEKKQCDALLTIDERNFHAWNYRRWTVGELARMKGLIKRFAVDLGGDMSLNEAKEGISNDEKQACVLFLSGDLEEFRFTTEMIKRNFSNYSAWHQRGLILRTAVHRLVEQHRKGQLQSDAIEREAWAQISEDLSLVTSAIYCDPVDQSAWYYAQFLQRAADMLSGIPSTFEGVDVRNTLVDASLELVAEECRLGGETDIYWPHLYILNVLLSEEKKNTDYGSGNKHNSATAAKVRAALFADNTDEDDWARCLRGLTEHLIAADPLRAGMYRCLAKKEK